MKLYLDKGFSSVLYGRTGKQYRFVKEQGNKANCECNDMDDLFYLLRDPDVMIAEDVVITVTKNGTSIDVKPLVIKEEVKEEFKEEPDKPEEQPEYRSFHKQRKSKKVKE